MIPQYSSLAPGAAEELQGFLASAARWALVRGEALALLTHIHSNSVDAVVTDWPYSSGGQFRGDRAGATGDKYIDTDRNKREREGLVTARADFEGDTRDQLSFVFWATLVVAECYRVAKPGSILGFWCDWRQLAAAISGLQAGGAVFRGVWGWDKTEGVRPQRGRPRNQLEFVVWGSKGAMAEDRCGGVVEPGVVRCASTLATKRGHQTGKPDAANRLWARLCEPGGILLDPFAGSASMADACLDEGRRYLGFEMVETIHADARQRLLQRTAAVGAAPLGDLFARSVDARTRSDADELEVRR